MREYQHYRRVAMLGNTGMSHVGLGQRLFVAPVSMSSSQDHTRQQRVDNDTMREDEDGDGDGDVTVNADGYTTQRFSTTTSSYDALFNLSLPEEESSSSAMAFGRSRDLLAEAGGVGNPIVGNIGTTNEEDDDRTTRIRNIPLRTPRELYDEHVALSKRIQRQQLAAMLGIGLEFTENNQQQVGLNIDIDSD